MTKSKFDDFAKNFVYRMRGNAELNKPITWAWFAECLEMALRVVERDIAKIGQETTLLRRVLKLRKEAYADGKTFDKGAIVSVNGSFFIARRTTSAPLNDQRDWQEISDIAPLPEFPEVRQPTPQAPPAPEPAPAPAQVALAAPKKRIVQRTKVIKHDAKGRILEMEREDIEVEPEAEDGQAAAAAGEHTNAAAAS